MRRSILNAAVAALSLLTATACSDNSAPSAPISPTISRAAVGVPVPPQQGRLGPEDFVDIVAGDYHTCARKLNQKVYCWGKNNLGQTGVTTTQSCAITSVACVNRPTLVITPLAGGDSILRAVQIDAGGDHTCVLDVGNAAWCWGENSQGQLGTSSYVNSGQPLRVFGRIAFTSIGAGFKSTCGTASAGMYCWGTLAQSNSRPTLVSSYNGYSNVVVGQSHACSMAILGSYRAVDCWGDNHYGQIGIDQAQMASGPFTVRAQFGESVSRVSTQQNVTCVDQTSGTVQCVGDNGMHQLGLPTSTWGSGIPQTIGGGQRLNGVSTGVFHACALDANSGAWCWGWGFYGQIGNGQSYAAQTPQPVTGGHTYRAIAVGYQHTCAIGTDNHIYCWGYNDFGQLGARLLNSWKTSPVQATDP